MKRARRHGVSRDALLRAFALALHVSEIDLARAKSRIREIEIERQLTRERLERPEPQMELWHKLFNLYKRAIVVLEGVVLIDGRLVVV